MAEYIQHTPVALGHGNSGGAGRQSQRGRQATAELHHKGIGLGLEQIGIDHRQILVIGGFIGGQLPDDAARSLAVLIETEIGVFRHFRQVETGIVRQAGRKMQIGARIDFQKPERRLVHQHALAVGEFAGIADALIVGNRNFGDREQLRQHQMRRQTGTGQHHHRQHVAARTQRIEPEQRARQPQQQRHHHQILRGQHIHRGQQQQPADAGADQIGEIDAVENGLRLLEYHPQKQRARQKRHQIECHIQSQPPFLRGIGNQKDRIERKLLHQQVAGDRQRTEQKQRQRRHQPPMGFEPAVGNAHHRTDQPETEHGKADDQRAEMRPAAHRENPHHGDLQGNQRTGNQRGGQIDAEGTPLRAMAQPHRVKKRGGH